MARDGIGTTTQLVTAFHAVLEAGQGEPLDAEEELMPPLTLKAFGHCAAAIQLAESGVRFPTLSSDYHDVGSVLVLCRAGFESLVTLMSLFLGGSPAAERRSRLLSWKIQGALERKTLRPRTADQRTIQAEDLAEAHRIRLAMAVEPYSQTLDRDSRRSLRRGHWRAPKSWPVVAEECGIDRRLAQDSYKHLCGYAHSGALSVRQIGDLGSPAEREEFASRGLWHLQVPLAKASLAYARRFANAQRMLDANPKIAATLQTWSDIGDNPP